MSKYSTNRWLKSKNYWTGVIVISWWCTYLCTLSPGLTFFTSPNCWHLRRSSLSSIGSPFGLCRVTSTVPYSKPQHQRTLMRILLEHSRNSVLFDPSLHLVEVESNERQSTYWIRLPVDFWRSLRHIQDVRIFRCLAGALARAPRRVDRTKSISNSIFQQNSTVDENSHRSQRPYRDLLFCRRTS